ncbi:MAG TPA: DUF1330 domain-containing protein [Candidatus Krumholzibacteria bacterium]|nr:DUF1330 domain-containing protein [Candidatus Krumholzibacteria bacterium]
MSAYVIVDIAVSNPERYEDYKAMAAESVERYDGRYVVRGGRSEPLEGAWEPQRVVVLEFPTYERAKAWWSSEDYREAKALRQAVAESRMIVVEGV